MGRPVFVLQHVPHETLGAIEPQWAEVGLECRHVELFRRPPETLDPGGSSGLVVMGGPMNVDEVDRYPFLRAEVGWIREAVEAEIPVLGVCLGAQLLAKALGAAVYPNRVKEIGWYEIELTPEAASDPLFEGCSPRQTVFQWHGDTFDLPTGAVHLATSALCRHQAFRYGPSAYGLQFHAEMTAALVDDWLGEAGNERELAEVDYIDPAAIRAQTPQCLPRMQTLGRQILPRFAAMCQLHG